MRVFLSLLAVTLLSVSAQAKGFYVSTYGGANWDSVVNVPGVEDNTGFVIGGTLGTDVTSVPGLSIEADMSFRQNEVDIFSFATVDHDSFALMVNAVYDVPVKLGPVHPYVLAGVGYGHSEATLENISIISVESSGLAWQLGAGVKTELAPGVEAGLGYRYVQMPELEVLGLDLSDGDNHSLVASVTFSFD
jgi:opacity protein-like surface antigen